MLIIACDQVAPCQQTSCNRIAAKVMLQPSYNRYMQWLHAT